MDTQVSPYFLEAPIASRPAPETTALGYIFHSTDTLETFVRAINPATNAPRWDPISGGASAQLSKYWVNVAGQIPVAPYTSIQAAVDAAVADGHGVSHPAVIYILPGAYIEKVRVPSGVSLYGLEGTDGGVALVGTLTILGGTLGITGINIVQGITISNPSGGVIIRNCFIQAAGVARDVITTSGTTVASQITITDCEIVSLPGFISIRQTSDARFELRRCTVTSPSTFDSMVFVSSVETIINRCDITGRISVGGDITTTNFSAKITYCSIAAVDTSLIFGSNNALIFLAENDYDQSGASAPLFDSDTSTSEFTHNDIPTASLTTSPVLGTRAFSRAVQTVRPYREESISGVGAGPVNLTGTEPDVIIIHNLAAEVVVNLPSVFKVFDGQRFTIRRATDSTAALDITPAAGETIEGETSLKIVASAANEFHGATLQAAPHDPGGQFWVVINVF